MKHPEEQYSSHELDQKNYWKNLAHALKNPISAAHWVDEFDKPVDRQMFLDIANWCLVRSELPLNDGKLLEIGCGNGLLLGAISEELVRKNLFIDLFGSDITQELLERAPTHLHLSVAPANKQPFPALNFDIIIIHSVIQYFEDMEYLDTVIDEITRILKPGGFIFLLDVINSNLELDAFHATKQDLKSKIYLFTPSLLRIIWKYLKSAVKSDYRNIFETVDGIRVQIPKFAGLKCSPEYFQDRLQENYKEIRIELQTYLSKPLTYRKYRFNVVAKKI